mgnify:CR=1 FL=1
MLLNMFFIIWKLVFGCFIGPEEFRMGQCSFTYGKRIENMAEKNCDTGCGVLTADTSFRLALHNSKQKPIPSCLVGTYICLEGILCHEKN